MSSSESESEEVGAGEEEEQNQEERQDDEKASIVHQQEEADKTFSELGLDPVLVEAATKVGWKKPSRIQAEAIPVALAGNDVIGLAETGSGKAAATSSVCICMS